MSELWLGGVGSDWRVWHSPDRGLLATAVTTHLELQKKKGWGRRRGVFWGTRQWIVEEGRICSCIIRNQQIKATTEIKEMGKHQKQILIETPKRDCFWEIRVGWWMFPKQSWPCMHCSWGTSHSAHAKSPRSQGQGEETLSQQQWCSSISEY